VQITGLKGPDTRKVVSPYAMPLRSAEAEPNWRVQTARRVRIQPVLGDCAGCATGGAIHGITGFDASDRDIWREAQRRESGRFDPNDGAYLEYAVDAVVYRGVIKYRPGEEYDTSATKETWLEGHEAYPHRQLNARHYRVNNLATLRSALLQNMAVVEGGGVTDKFMRRGPAQADVPAGLDELGGSDNGHAQRIRGYWNRPNTFDADVLLYQGSWGEGFAGCWLPDRTWAAGCFWALADTFRDRWDCWALDLKDWV
jgi:hypothetical protein